MDVSNPDTTEQKRLASEEPPLPGIDGFTYADLHRPSRLKDLAGVFYDEVKAASPDLWIRWETYSKGAKLSDVERSNLIVEMAPALGNFVERLFHIQGETAAQRQAALDLHVVFEFRKQFVKKRVLKQFSPDSPPAMEPGEAQAFVDHLLAAVLGEACSSDPEIALASAVMVLVEAEKPIQKNSDEASAARARIGEARVALAKRTGEQLGDLHAADPDLSFLSDVFQRVAAHCYYLSLDSKGEHGYHAWVSLKQPHALDYENLVQIERPNRDIPEVIAAPDAHLRRRDGFELTDPRMSFKQALEEVDYCLYCHERDKDSCTKGFHTKEGDFKRNPLGIKQAGCPLDEKISEAHLLKRAGESIASLAVVMIDNPMCPGTGHRICNDCMKGCIFQKQEPVNIPQIETRILDDVLHLPWGLEIYGLLSRWNPLNPRRPYALPYNGKNVLVVGMGPAGYTLAHYLLNEGFGVTGIDGLKIEPLPRDLTGHGDEAPRPVRDIGEIVEPLDHRVLAGFGGVSEYGITVRWDKNFLSVIHLTLARRRTMKIYGGIRFGGTLDIDDAWSFGFDHIAIASGAGRPTIIKLKNNLIRGIRKASDFLMALQLTGAFKKNSLANLQVRLPAVIIGGGLTAIDTATELLAYYIVQCEKFLHRYEVLSAERGSESIDALFRPDERLVAAEFVEHGRLIRAERERAAAAGERPDFASLVRAWGGVSIAYRKRMQDAPAYRLNHEEIAKALEEGIYFAECLDPREAVPDELGAVSAVRFERARRDEDGTWHNTGEIVELPARAVCVAAGTSPNTIYERERPGTFTLDTWGQYFTNHSAVTGEDGSIALVPSADGVFTSYQNAGRLISYYGDNHPGFAGNVVKAMASAKHGYPQVVAVFEREISDLDPAEQASRDARLAELHAKLDDLLIARVVRVERLTPTIVDVIVRAPLAASRFHPGQFYRLQNYEKASTVVGDTTLTMEGLALTGAWVDPGEGLLSLIVLEMGGSSRLCAHLRPGDEVVVMGPTGTPTEIPTGETVLLAGGGLGNAVLFSIAKALRANGNHVLYFAGYKNPVDVFKRDEIEEATDQVVWASDVEPRIEPRRPQDLAFVGNIVKAMTAYASGELGGPLVNFGDVDRIIAIGSDAMMEAVKNARHGILAPYLTKHPIAIGSINSPMQCMMKEICAQCLQKHVDPETGVESVVFSCFNQDQELDRVDFNNLKQRLRMNSVQEKLTNEWLSHLLATSATS